MFYYVTGRWKIDRIRFRLNVHAVWPVFGGKKFNVYTGVARLKKKKKQEILFLNWTVKITVLCFKRFVENHIFEPRRYLHDKSLLFD